MGEIMIMNDSTKPTKLFISHSIKDLSYVSHLVRLLQIIGMSNDNMFCSSVKGFDIPLGNNIYDYLREQFQNYELKVIFILSNNYYDSVASLNEMGAAWALQPSYTSILLPKFEFNDIKGAIDPRNISIKLDSAEREIKGRMNELYEELQTEFNLRGLQQIVWEGYRDEFIEKVHKTSSIWEHLRYLKEQNRPAPEWILPLNQLVDMDSEGFDALYMLSNKYLQIGNAAKAAEYIRRAEKAASNEEMRNSIKCLKQSMMFS